MADERIERWLQQKRDRVQEEHGTRMAAMHERELWQMQTTGQQWLVQNVCKWARELARTIYQRYAERLITDEDFLRAIALGYANNWLENLARRCIADELPSKYRKLVTGRREILINEFTEEYKDLAMDDIKAVDALDAATVEELATA